MQVKRILAPVDFSENSITAVRYAAEFAKINRAEIFLIHVTDPDSLANELRGNLDPENLMELLRNESFMKGIKTTLILRKGKIANVILDESKLNEIDLIVMGTRGAGNAARNLFGTTATRVIGKSTCTVLAIPDEAVFRPMKKIVVATDMKQDSQQIIEEFISVIKKINAAVLLVYVGNDKEMNFKQGLEKLTAKLKLQTSYDKIVSKVIESSEFRMKLEDFALNIEADLLVMISHHRGIFESIFDPSESKLYAYHTTIPLMVIQQHRTPVFFF